MKRITALLLFLAFVGVIVLPVTSTFNNSLSDDIRIADGATGPMPPLPPNVFSTSGTGVQV